MISNESLLVNAITVFRDKKFVEAQALVEQYLQQDSENADAWLLLANCLDNRNLNQAAICAYQHVLRIRGPAAAIYSRIGSCYRKLDLLSEALSFHQKAIELQADNSTFWVNYGIAQREAGLYKEALASYTKAIELDPNNFIAMFGQATIHLLYGEYEIGFKLLECRTKVFPNSYLNRTGFPEWTGESLENKTILILEEQGYGDTILFSRFIRLLKKKYRPKKVILLTVQILASLLNGLEGLDATLASPVSFPISSCDFQVNIMSLAQYLQIDSIKSIPPPPILSIPQEDKQRLAVHLKPYEDKFKIGIVWTGRSTNQMNHLRSVPIEYFLRLLEVPDIELFNFHKGIEENGIRDLGMTRLIHDLAPHFNDFADTAAGIEAMDLIITIDSSTAHLAGTLGKPTWLLLHNTAYWVWLEKGEKSPWYPSIRIYRQGGRGNWNEVFDKVVNDLAKLRGVKTKALKNIKFF